MKLSKILLIFLALLIIAPVILWLLDFPDPGNGMYFIYSLSQLGALLGFTLFEVQFILGAKLKFVERYFGHDKMVVFHRKIGVAAFLLVLFHALAIITMRTTAFLSYKIALLLGAIAISLLIFMLLFIIARKYWRSKYEYWEIVHRLNYLTFLVAYIHSLLVGSTLQNNLSWQILWVVLGVCFLGVIIYKLGVSYRIHHHRFQVVKVIQETASIWTICFEPCQFKFLPGQFMILHLAYDGILHEPHPFTIASSPTADMLAVSIKSVGDFTGKIGRTKPGDYALIDAPYGRFSFLNFSADNYLFIAGGIGITPFMSMLRFMRDNKITKRVLLLWGNRTKEDVAFRDELNLMEQAMVGLQVVYVMSEQRDWNGETGFITAALIKKYAGELIDKEIFICGPPIMMTMVLKELKTFKVPRRQIHFERFTW